ncbi:dTDP-4-dehydrorhamnose reductase [bacterium]|nr:dTDP-4-dehydrorhamnose reductase [bacterium]
MRVLVTGAEGQLGRSLVARLGDAGHQPVGIDLADGDLADPGVAARLLAELGPDQVVHAAAYTAVDRAESERDLAERGNAVATARLAEACDAAGCALTAISTDYVFDGEQSAGYREDATRRPVNWYGETKAHAEEAVLAMVSARSRVVRTSWLFGHGPANFVRTMRRLLAERDRLRVVDDQHGSPTYGPDLARLVVDLLGTDAGGVFHGTNRGVTTWCGFAREIARLSGHDPARIEPCTSEEYPTPAARPRWSVLLETRLDALGIAPAPGWQDGLARYLAWLDRQEAEEGARP